MERAKVIKNEEFLGVVHAILRQTIKTIDICTYKFEISKNKSTRGLNELIKTLTLVAGRGIAIRILLETNARRNGVSRYNLYAAGILKKSGIRCKTLPHNRCQHAKLILVDDEIAVIGSHNWTPKSITSNYEISVVIRDRAALENTKEHFDKIWEKGIKI